MVEKITEDQLNQIVAEVAHLSRRRETELDRQQVQEILQQLNLPSELLDEAMIELQRKNDLAVQQHRNWLIGIGLGTVLVIGITSTVIISQNHQQKLGRIKVYESRITQVQDNGENLVIINRQNHPEVYYRVTLQDAPVGEKLSLKCNWIDPNGQIAHQNNYQTRQINKSVWQTHCRYQLNIASPSGNWQVQMSLGNQILNQKSFTVK
ncbi:hypothetical protein [Gloeothece verrucosa]|uniref:DUF3859 domain-containing protein n=1 Tax=Gloeothece verrucosa (strain PCC 7822) TaxID=497965 RepID=E0UMU0_GLOV7|nr:hypothetical protein [Gloeothece verrucosa]ADN18270.1 conserved hypothetical protein [Gloeothece verrucosa PCC 7822]